MSTEHDPLSQPGMLNLGVIFQWCWSALRLQWEEVPQRMNWCGEWEICGPARKVKRGRPMLMDWQITALRRIFPADTVEQIARFYSRHPEGPRNMVLSMPRTCVKREVMSILAGVREW